MSDAATPLLIDRLQLPEAYPHATAEIRLIETHISWVLLTGHFVYKIKKPCNHGFLDFTTLEKRQHFCEEEIRISGRFAPQLYLAAVPITGSFERPRVGGTGEPIEWAVKLVQFDEDERLDRVFEAGRLDREACRRLGRRIAEIHAGLPRAESDSDFGSPERVREAAGTILEQLARHRPEAALRAAAVGRWLDTRIAANRDVMLRRMVSGSIRGCHGDLHLANLVLHEGQLTPFDAIEFSPSLRWIDVANDIAFLVMDLEARGRPDLAAEVGNAWIESSGDHAAARVLPLYRVSRAAVRAAVAAIQLGQSASADETRRAGLRAESDRYLDLAERIMAPPRPVMLATCGVSGSGKSRLAAELVAAVPAIRLRSDVERKRMAGLSASDPGGAGLYDAAATRATYERLAEQAAAILAAGTSVVVDATCSRRDQRERLAAVATRAGVPLVWLALEAPRELLAARIAARAAEGGDPSDADTNVLAAQLDSREPITSAELAASDAILMQLGPADTEAASATAQRIAALATQRSPDMKHNPAKAAAAGIACVFAALMALMTVLQGDAVAAKPNIVVVLFDDMGYGEPPCYRCDSELETPRLDGLAAAGMRFTDAHSPSSVCTPTRYGLLTGRYPSRIGQYGVLQSFDPPLIEKSRLTVASLLERHGYETACIGKWHLGLEWNGVKQVKGVIPIGSRIVSGPNQLGFDYFYGYTHARNIETIIEQDRVVEHVRAVENQPRMIARAVEWLEKREADKPFFLYFPMCPPHTPIVPSPEFAGTSGAKDTVKNDPRYGDWVYQGDHMLGQILDTLEKKGLAANTLVIATADNGASHRRYPPLRGKKTEIYEGGHRVPFVAKWPGNIEPGSVCDQTICLTDLLATCADILDVKLPATAGEDSVSILPGLLGTAAEPLREAIIHQPLRRQLAIRQGPWKLIFSAEGAGGELYDLHNDLGETTNVASKHPEVVETLTALLKRSIAEGRSTPGAKQPAEPGVKWPVR